jgi:hypothetical protein
MQKQMTFQKKAFHDNVCRQNLNPQAFPFLALFLFGFPVKLQLHLEESVLGPDGLPEMGRVRPFIYDSARQEYHAIGKLIGKAFSAGKELKG